jgi:hypothetical protein
LKDEILGTRFRLINAEVGIRTTAACNSKELN